MSKIVPIGKRILVRPSKKEETTKSGIIVPDALVNPSFFVGEVTAITKEITTVKVGDLIAHKKYGMEIMPTDDGERYLVEEASVIAIYE